MAKEINGAIDRKRLHWEMRDLEEALVKLEDPEYQSIINEPNKNSTTALKMALLAKLPSKVIQKIKALGEVIGVTTADNLHGAILMSNPELLIAHLEGATPEMVNSVSWQGKNLLEETLIAQYRSKDAHYYKVCGPSFEEVEELGPETTLEYYHSYSLALEKMKKLGAKTAPNFQKISYYYSQRIIPLVIVLVREAFLNGNMSLDAVALRHDISMKPVEEKYTLLESAIAYRKPELAAVLRSFDVKTQPNESKLFDCPPLLLEAFVNDINGDNLWLVNAEGPYERKVLMHTLKANRDGSYNKAIELLRAKGAKSAATAYDLKNALEEEPENPGKFKVLVQEAAELGIINQKNGGYDTLLMQAIKMNKMHQYDRAIKVLKDNGANIDINNDVAATYLCRAHEDKGRFLCDLLQEI